MARTLSDNLALPNCPTCDGSGYWRADKNDVASIDVRTCHCVLRRRSILDAARRLINSGLPGVYAEAEISKMNERDGTVLVRDTDRDRMVNMDQALIDRENKEKLRLLASEPLPTGQTVILVGPPGAGKTYGAAALLREQIRRWGKSGLYVTSYNYVNTMRPDHATVADQMSLQRRASGVDILLLDDLGIEKSSPATMRELWYLIDERSKHGRATIVTSNLTINEVFGLDKEIKRGTTPADTIEAYEIGARIYSRFREARFIISWPKGMADWRDEIFKRKEASNRSLPADRAARAGHHREGEGE